MHGYYPENHEGQESEAGNEGKKGVIVAVTAAAVFAKSPGEYH